LALLFCGFVVACGLQDNNKYQFLCLELETLNDSLILLKACVNCEFHIL
jgi:hypothetical protein